MKRLKFDHQLAEEIRKGAKTSTWRLYDDKDISVNDVLELLDKVDPGDPSTWRPIGNARVTSVMEKRLGDIEAHDLDGHGAYASKDEMLKAFQEHYGPQVTFDTAIKIIRFELISEGFKNKQMASIDEEYTTEIKEVKLYADGGSRGNPGPSASGFALMDMDSRILVKKGVYLGITTNNQAEYQALKLALEEARKMHVQKLHVYMDSLLVVNQMLGIFKVKNRDLWPIHEACKELSKQFKHISFTHVPRTLNKIADAEVNEALDAAGA